MPSEGAGLTVQNRSESDVPQKIPNPGKPVWWLLCIWKGALSAGVTLFLCPGPIWHLVYGSPPRPHLNFLFFQNVKHMNNLHKHSWYCYRVDSLRTGQTRRKWCPVHQPRGSQKEARGFEGNSQCYACIYPPNSRENGA